MYDVVVVGGGTAGVAAAYMSGKIGLKTLLVEKKIHLGGAITSGLVLPVMNAGQSEINRDFYNDLVNYMKDYDAQIEFQGNDGWFNPEILKIVLDKMLNDVGVEVRFLTTVSDIELTEKNISKLYLFNEILFEPTEEIYSDNNQSGNGEILSEPIETRYVVDATGNCNIGLICGCNFIESSKAETQPLSLRFIMGGVDIVEFARFLRNIDSNVDVTPMTFTNGEWHLTTAYTWDNEAKWALRPLFQKAIVAGDLTEEDSNYFQIFTVAGSEGEVAFNCPRIAKNVDISDIKAVSSALMEARESIFRLANFVKKYFKGFENAYISNIADDLGIRVSRRIEGKYVYTIDDLMSGKQFDTPVLEANYPIDIHSYEKNESMLEEVGYYQLPIESLMAKDIDNLFVIGRCLSADFKAQAALRVQQSCFSMGEAVAKYISTLGF